LVTQSLENIKLKEMTKFEKCLETAIRFQPHLRDKYAFTYIGPKDPEQYRRFINHIQRIPCQSFTQLLADPNITQENLKILFGEDLELEIYVGTHDYMGVFLLATLDDYIDKYKITFNH
jgi:hypothetical protein